MKNFIKSAVYVDYDLTIVTHKVNKQAPLPLLDSSQCQKVTNTRMESNPNLLELDNLSLSLFVFRCFLTISNQDISGEPMKSTANNKWVIVFTEHYQARLPVPWLFHNAKNKIFIQPPSTHDTNHSLPSCILFSYLQLNI